MVRRRIAWLAGAVVAAWLTPAGPASGWQPPADERIVGFLADGRTLVTVNHIGNPIHYWHSQTGELIGRLPAGPAPAVANLTPGTAWVAVVRPDPTTAAEPVVPVRCGWDGVSRGRPPRHLNHSLKQLSLSMSKRATLDVFDLATGRQHATFRATPRYQATWTFSADGRTLAVNSRADDEDRIDLYDVASATRIRSIRGADTPLCLSADGERVACVVGGSYLIAATRSDRELARFEGMGTHPVAFSVDGSRLLGGTGGVFDVAAGRAVFRIADATADSCRFTPDGETVIAVTSSDAGAFVERYDARTGEPRPESRRPLVGGHRHMTRLAVSTDDRRVAAAAIRFDPPATVATWAARLPGLGDWDRMTVHAASEVADAASGEVVWRGPVCVEGFAPDGRLLVYDPATGGTLFWDAIPRRPWWWVAASITAWSAAVVAFALTWRIVRRWRRLDRIR